MAVLSPALAAAFANDVYTLRQDRDVRAIVDKHKEYISGGQTTRAQGTSGALVFIKKTSGFGLLAKGRGVYENDAFVLLRGTSTLYDALTDANIGVSISQTGYLVHSGFNSCFNSILPDIRKFVTEHGGKVNNIHCVGHSLGGALATMTADWVHANTGSRALLYTFGSPRVGQVQFSQNVTKRLPNEGIYRAHHKTDVVTMVPVWPFMHVPEPGRSYYLNSPGDIPGGEFHKMANYIKSVGKLPWTQLLDKAPERYSEQLIVNWLNSDGAISLTFNTIEIINWAIVYVLEKIGYAALVLMQSFFSSTFTLLDQLAFILRKSIDLAGEVSAWVIRLIKRIMQVLGIKVKAGIDMTARFIREIFAQLSQRVNALVRKALIPLR